MSGIKTYKGDKMRDAAKYIAEYGSIQRIYLKETDTKNAEAIIYIEYADGADDISEPRNPKTGLVHRELLLACPYMYTFNEDNYPELRGIDTGNIKLNPKQYLEFTEEIESAISDYLKKS